MKLVWVVCGERGRLWRRARSGSGARRTVTHGTQLFPTLLVGRHSRPGRHGAHQRSCASPRRASRRLAERLLAAAVARPCTRARACGVRRVDRRPGSGARHCLTVLHAGWRGQTFQDTSSSLNCISDWCPACCSAGVRRCFLQQRFGAPAPAREPRQSQGLAKDLWSVPMLPHLTPLLSPPWCSCRLATKHNMATTSNDDRSPTMCARSRRPLPRSAVGEETWRGGGEEGRWE